MIDIAEKLQLIAEQLESGKGQTVEISYANIFEGAAEIKRLREALEVCEAGFQNIVSLTGRTDVDIRDVCLKKIEWALIASQRGNTP